MLLAAVLAGVGICRAEDAPRKANAPLDEILVQGTRASDEHITQQVQTALSNDPWIYAEHITVTTEHGIVHVEGMVGDSWEMRRVLREARKAPGVRRVVNELEMFHNDPDGG